MSSNGKVFSFSDDSCMFFSLDISVTSSSFSALTHSLLDNISSTSVGTFIGGGITFELVLDVVGEVFVVMVIVVVVTPLVVVI